MKMKKKQRIFAWLMVFVLLLSGAAVQGTNSKKAVAATTVKCYKFSLAQSTKVGNYYYRVNDSMALQRSKSKTKNYKTIVSAMSNNGIYLSTGKMIYYATYAYDKEASTVYSCKMDGTSKKKILTAKKFLEPSMVCQNKLYFTEGFLGYSTYSTPLKGKAKLSLEKKKLRLFNEANGQYIIGAMNESDDADYFDVCIYNTKAKKVISLGAGTAANMVGKKVYYASVNKSTERVTIRKCNPDGSKKEVVSVLDSAVWGISKLTSTYCIGCSRDNGDAREQKFYY